MTTSMVMLVLAAFLASAVEAVEAFTLVLAVGVTRGWRSTLIGAGTATLTLAAVIAAFGPALSLMPLGALRVMVGTLLLIFGLQWLRKAILRAGGYKALRDEDAYYLAERAAARAAGLTRRAGMDWYAFTLAFKGVFLEGLEVAFIVSSPLAPRRGVYHWPSSAPASPWCWWSSSAYWCMSHSGACRKTP